MTEVKFIPKDLSPRYQTFPAGKEVLYLEEDGTKRRMTLVEYNFLLYHHFKMTRLTDGLVESWQPFYNFDIEII
jgi:hypothetical protein